MISLMRCVLGGIVFTASITVPQPQVSAVLKGEIYDSLFGTLLPEAKVEVFAGDRLQKEVISDQNGKYEIKGLPDGQYKIVVQLLGFVTARQELKIMAGKQARLDIGLKAGYLHDPLEITIHGVVKQADDLPLSGATIVLISPFDQAIIAKTRTDDLGKYSLQINDPGQYVLYASKQEFRVKSSDIVIWPKLPREPQEVNFVLSAFKLQ